MCLCVWCVCGVCVCVRARLRGFPPLRPYLALGVRRSRTTPPPSPHPDSWNWGGGGGSCLVRPLRLSLPFSLALPLPLSPAPSRSISSLSLAPSLSLLMSLKSLRFIHSDRQHNVAGRIDVAACGSLKSAQPPYRPARAGRVTCACSTRGVHSMLQSDPGGRHGWWRLPNGSRCSHRTANLARFPLRVEYIDPRRCSMLAVCCWQLTMEPGCILQGGSCRPDQRPPNISVRCLGSHLAACSSSSFGQYRQSSWNGSLVWDDSGSGVVSAPDSDRSSMLLLSLCVTATVLADIS